MLAGAQLSHAAPEASLDPSDFPALGGGAAQGPTSASTAAHLAAQQAQQHLAQQQHRQQQHSLQQQQQSQQSILSSYASQASPATPAPPSTAGSTANGAAPRRTAGDSASDDFPALGGLPHLANGGTSAGSPAPAASAPGQPLLPPGMGMGMFGGAGAAAAPGAGAGAGAGAAGELSALAQGVDTLSLAAARAAVSQGGQEQASALAALQAQQQHRASLLGAMNAQRGAGAAGGFAPPGGDKTVRPRIPSLTHSRSALRKGSMY